MGIQKIYTQKNYSIRLIAQTSSDSIDLLNPLAPFDFAQGERAPRARWRHIPVFILAMLAIFWTSLVHSISVPSRIVALDSLQRIVVCAQSFNGSNFDMAVVRYNTVGSLDLTFGNINSTGNRFPGMSTVDFNHQDDDANSLLIDNNNKIVIAGYATNTKIDPTTGILLEFQNFALARFLAHGSLDLTFNANSSFSASKPGTVQTTIGVTAEANALIQDSNQKLVAAGFSNAGTPDQNLIDSFTLARYNPDGSLDTTFGTNGIVITEFDDDTVIQGLTQDSSNNLVAVGSLGATDFLIARYKPDGDLDDTFNASGDIPGTIDLEIDDPNTGDPLSSEAYAVIIDNANNIVVAGVGYLDNTASLIVARFLPDGTLDPNFGDFGDNGGLQIIPITSANIIVDSLTIDSNNKIVVSATSRNLDGSDYNFNDPFALLRLNSDGTIDTSFTQHDLVVVPSTKIRAENTVSVSNSVIIDAHHRILVTGFFNQSRNINTMILARYSPNGVFDPTFNPFGSQPGVVITDLFFGASTPDRFVQVGPLNKIYAAKLSFNGVSYDMALLRFNPDGSLDTTFGIQLTALQLEAEDTVANPPIPGQVTLDVFGGNDVANSMVVDLNFQPVIAGFAGIPRPLQPFAQVVDLSSTSTVSIGSGVSEIITTSTEIRQFCLARYHEDGTLDASFDPANPDENESNKPGVIVTEIGRISEIEGLIIDSQQNYVAAGFSNEGIDEFDNVTLARYLPVDGSLDKTFGPFGDGTVITEFDADSIAYGITEDQNDRLVICGAIDFARILVARYNADGSLDATFNPLSTKPGSRILDIPGFQAEAYSVSVDHAHRIVIAGVAQNGIAANLVIIRFRPDGVLDHTFGTAGIRTINVPYFNIIVDSLVIDQDDKIVVSGTSRNTDVTLKSAFNFAEPFIAIRLNSDGTTDTTFQTHGFVAMPTAVPPGLQQIGLGENTFTDVSNTVLIDNQNRILMGGYFNERTKVNDLLLARFLPNGRFDRTFNPGGTDTGRLIDPNNITNSSTVIPPGVVLVNTFVDTTTTPPGGSPSPALSTTSAQEQPLTKEEALKYPHKAVTVNITPIIEYPQKGMLINTRSARFTGHARPSGFISLSIDNKIAAIIPTNTLGEWDYLADLTDGKHTVIISNLDTTGKSTLTSEAVNFTVSTEPLQAPALITPKNNEKLKESTVAITGSSKPNVLVAIFIDNNLAASVRADSKGSWSYELDLKPGDHAIYAAVTDGISNMSPYSRTIKFSVAPAQLKPPVILAPIHDTVIRSGRVDFKGTGLAESTIALILDNKEIARITTNRKGEWSHTAHLPNGQYTIHAFQVDKEHTQSKPSPDTIFTIDRRKKTRQKNNMPSILTQNTNLSGKAHPDSDVTILFDGKPIATVQSDQSGKWSYNFSINQYHDGEHELGLLVTDNKAHRTWLTTRKITIKNEESATA